ncbi:hypothetical protein JCM8202v2_005691 [Rhodotorula sphaerocarpa]
MPVGSRKLVRRTRRQGTIDAAQPPVTGLDIGTGASAIYPLLAVRYAASPAARDVGRVRMLATDIDAESLQYARDNVARNKEDDSMSIHQVEPGGPIFPSAVTESATSIDFTMCNPPFYSSAEEIASSQAGKERLPFAACTGAENEMITPGGEVAFVARMIDESLHLGVSKIRWFTSLLGKYSSIAPLIERLEKEKISNYHVSALPRHGRTIRWVLCWSLQDSRVPPFLVEKTLTADRSAPAAASLPLPSFPLARFLSPSVAPLRFAPPSFERPDDISELKIMLEAALEELAPPGPDSSAERSLVWSIAEPDSEEEEEAAPADARHKSIATVITAWKNVWSRQARRAAKIAPPAAAGERSGSGPSDPRAPHRNTADETAAAAPTRTAAPLLELRIEIERASPDPSSAPSTAQASDSRSRLAGWWIRGEERDRPAVEGLWGFLTRRVGDECRRRRGPGAPGPSKGDAGAGEGTEADGDAGVGGTSRRKRRKVA